MRWRFLFFGSLGVNVALAAVWFVSMRRQSASLAASLTPTSTTTSVKTNVVVRRQFFSWSEVESADYPTYIANLRDIGCPEQTVRDIIIAEINALYARRVAMEVITPEQQWWRPEPDTNVIRVAAEALRRLEDERRGLLSRLLGIDWESGDLVNLPRPSHPGIALDGPVLGALPMDVKQSIQEISSRGQDRLQAYLSSQRQLGKAADPVEMARLRQITREELSRILTASQLEEYLLRYSQNANDLRAEVGDLDYFNASPDEFRAIFRATDTIDQQLSLLSGSTDPNSVLARRNLETQRDAALKTALGANRYEQFHLLHDPIYRDAVAAAAQANTPDAVQTIYEINLATAQQQATIRANTNLTAEQRQAEQARITAEQMKARLQAMGQEIPTEPQPAPVAAPQPINVRTHAYVLGVGDTVGSVAVRYGVSMNAIKAVNPDVDFRKLKPGDAILVPDSLPPVLR